MSSSHIFWPVLVQIFLTLAMLIFLGARKAKAEKACQVSPQLSSFCHCTCSYFRLPKKLSATAVSQQSSFLLMLPFMPCANSKFLY
jgi:hypothetical protein